MPPRQSPSPADRLEDLGDGNAAKLRPGRSPEATGRAGSQGNHPGPDYDPPPRESCNPYCDVRDALLRARAAINDAIARLPAAGGQKRAPTRTSRRNRNARTPETIPRRDKGQGRESGGQPHRRASRSGKIVVDIRPNHRSITFPDDRPTIRLANDSIMLIDALNVRRGEIENSGALGCHEIVGGHKALELRTQLIKDFKCVGLPRKDVRLVVALVRRRGMRGYLLADGLMVKGGTAGHTVSTRGAAPLSAAEGEDVLRRHGMPYSSRRGSRRSGSD